MGGVWQRAILAGALAAGCATDPPSLSGGGTLPSGTDATGDATGGGSHASGVDSEATSQGSA